MVLTSRSNCGICGIRGYDNFMYVLQYFVYEKYMTGREMFSYNLPSLGQYIIICLRNISLFFFFFFSFPPSPPLFPSNSLFHFFFLFLVTPRGCGWRDHGGSWESIVFIDAIRYPAITPNKSIIDPRFFI